MNKSVTRLVVASGVLLLGAAGWFVVPRFWSGGDRNREGHVVAPAPPTSAHAGHAGGAPVAAPPAPGPGDAPPGYAPVVLPGEREQRFGVRTEPAKEAVLSRTVRTVGLIRTDETRESTVRVKWSGWIEGDTAAFVGQSVRKGDELFRVYSPDLVVAQQEYLVARRRREAARTGSADAGVSLDSAEALYDAARTKLRLWDVPDDLVARIDASQEPERVVSARAPRAGTILERSARPGLYVEPSMDLYTIADLSMVWVLADVYEFEAPLARVGQEGTFQLLGGGPAEVPVTVAFVAPTVDSMTRTVKVRFEVPNPDGTLRPGAFGTVRLPISLGPALTVPSDAVIDTGTRSILFVRTGPGLFSPREVTLGAHADDRVQILAGLVAGEEVVVRAQFLLDSESRLRGATGASAPAHGGH